MTAVRLELEVEGDSLSGSFTFHDTQTTFAGKRAGDGSVSGTYEQGENAGTFQMQRAGVR